jgi:hypothetical protein
LRHDIHVDLDELDPLRQYGFRVDHDQQWPDDRHGGDE